MEEKGRGRKRKPNRKPDRQPNNNGMSEDLIKAIGHPLRRRILRTLHKAGEARSPAEFSEAFRMSVSNISYHVTVLKKKGAIVLTDTMPARGALEHFYASTLTSNASVNLILKSTEAEDKA